MASNRAEPGPSPSSGSGQQRGRPAGRPGCRPDAAAPPADERFGPLALVRSAKEDGRQLILYAHDDREA
ncbi:MAG TPA: hypothetical protein VGY13_14115 [Solirubrobacteraceae bacterium]|jgi:hypothetical protein|nr:hypothetical protein [Solirubrobacteraceae bacterium]